ncbi:response regulator transcription factor [Salisaeta longa]|uniref:response regulator transcription factor n=1 Tax=Salisaeta longa TaxID=503170 RepID=UPI0003B486B8|nr:response regulator transcription factor [Salisaeta longa]
MKLVLLVEDEPELADTLLDGIEAHGYRVHHMETAEDALKAADEHNYDAMVVDWMLPGMNGPKLIKTLRDKGHHTPAMMLTVRDSVSDRVEGLESGADDYLTKPFSFEELLARLRALLRRPTSWQSIDDIHVGPLHIDMAQRRVYIGDTTLELRKKEFDLLRLVAERAPAVVPRNVIARRVWGSSDVSNNAIDVTVSTLRQHLREAYDGDEDLQLKTVRGVGYRLETDE